MSDSFHDRVGIDPLLSPLFPKDLTAVRERFALYVAEQLGGPKNYTAKRGKQSLLCRHAHLSISTAEANRWLAHIFVSIDDEELAGPVRQVLRNFFIETAQTLTDPYIPLYRMALPELAAQIERDPELLNPSKTGHSLLREAVMRWDAPRVDLLLNLGADANSQDGFMHGPLYFAANAVVPDAKADGRKVVQLLIDKGANLNAQSGPVRCAPLHMAARRGTVFIAELLLDAGADIEVRDRKGETPLRRSVNCGHEPMVRFLLSRGANLSSRDNYGLTPLSTARHDLIRLALRQVRSG